MTDTKRITLHSNWGARQQPEDTYTIRGIFVYVCPGQLSDNALQGTVAGVPNNEGETRTRFCDFLRTCVRVTFRGTGELNCRVTPVMPTGQLKTRYLNSLHSDQQKRNR